MHVFTNENERPIDFEVTGGEIHDSQVAGKWIEMDNEQLSSSGHEPVFFFADEAFDSENIRAQAAANQFLPVIPMKIAATKLNVDFDAKIHKMRQVVENFYEDQALSRALNAIRKARKKFSLSTQIGLSSGFRGRETEMRTRPSVVNNVTFDLSP